MPSNAFGGESFWWAGARARGESLACILGARSGAPAIGREESGPQRNERKEPAPRWWGVRRVHGRFSTSLAARTPTSFYSGSQIFVFRPRHFKHYSSSFLLSQLPSSHNMRHFFFSSSFTLSSKMSNFLPSRLDIEIEHDSSKDEIVEKL